MRIRVFLLFLAPLLFLLLTVRSILRCVRLRRRFLQADCDTEGTVTAVRSQQIRKGLYSFSAAARYTVDGKTYSAKFRPFAENTPECPFRQGDPVTVHYQAEHPEDGFVLNTQSKLMSAFGLILCMYMLLFCTLLITGSIVRFDTGWFTLSERRLIGAVRLAGLTLILLAFIVVMLLAVLALSKKSGNTLTGTVREIRQFGKQTVLCTEYVHRGKTQFIRLPKEPGDKQEYAVGDSVRFRMIWDSILLSIERPKKKSGSAFYWFVLFAAAAALSGFLIEDLLDLLKL